ncbi:TPA: hypothetical protein ACNRRD_006395 [Pseudomonas aeruginosa]|nr:hypothetical protein [Pseudomonas aeruginosa]ETD78805.1 hypothetical protein V527_21255 [Pseudomonas aeruginosa VRFPA06]MDV2795673.1 hypothetical protein [Pseudomonas aeruginosa]
MTRSNAPLVQSEAELCAAFIDEFNRVPGRLDKSAQPTLFT